MYKMANLKVLSKCSLVLPVDDIDIVQHTCSSLPCPDRAWAGLAGLGWAGLGLAGDSSQFSELMKNEGSILTGHWTPADVKRAQCLTLEVSQHQAPAYTTRH